MLFFLLLKFKLVFNGVGVGCGFVVSMVLLEEFEELEEILVVKMNGIIKLVVLSLVG